MARIKEIRGNIFESTSQVLVNTVNCVGIMGKGIALEFKYRFPEMYKDYIEACKRKYIRPGKIYLWKESEPWILNFPTKNHWRYPSKIEYIEDGLKDFSGRYQDLGITSIAFPMLGTQSGGLNWDVVKQRMYHYIDPLENLDVEIYHYDPRAKDSKFDKFYQKVHRFNVDDYIEYLGVRRREAEKLMEIINNGSVNSFSELENISGLGKKTRERIDTFLRESSSRVITRSEREPELPFP